MKLITLLQAPTAAPSQANSVPGHALLAVGLTRALCLIAKAQRASNSLNADGSKSDVRPPPEISPLAANAVADARILVVEAAESATSFAGATIQTMNCVSAAKRLQPSVPIDVCSMGDADSALFRQVIFQTLIFI